MVAGLNTLFGYSLYSLLLFIGFYFVWATLIGQVVGIMFNFKTYGTLVFRNKDNSLIVKFIAIYGFTYLCNIISLGYLINICGLSDYIAGAIMVIPIGLLSFVLNKIIVFKKINQTIDDTKSTLTMKELIKQWIQNKSRLIYTIIVILGLVFMIWGSFDAGMSGDERTHEIQAEHVYNYYSTWGADTTAVDLENQGGMPAYGQGGDNLAYAISRWFEVEDTMQIRHTLSVVISWLAMLFAGLLAFRLGNRKWLPAIITFVLFFFSPRFLGHSFNNLKDANLAALVLIGIYYIVVFLQEFPKVRKITLVMFALALGFALAVRIGALILIAYLGLFGLIYFIKKYSFKGVFGGKDSGLFWGQMVWKALLACVGGYIIGVILWPYALQAPIQHTVEAFSAMSHFVINIRQLFEGQLQWSNQLPWYYTPKFIAMTIPIAVMVGALIRLVTGWRKGQGFWTFLLLFCFVFPVFWITYTKANVYGGWRHSMFAYPTLVVLAGLGFSSLVEAFTKPALRYACIALPFLLLWHPIKHYICNHPYEYVYFNELSGGVKKALGVYEMDYYYHSTREATEWVLKNADTSRLKPGEKIQIASWHIASVEYYARKDTAHFSPTFSRIYDMGNRDWDYAVFTVTGMNPDWLKNPKTFPPSNTVYTVKVDDVPICIVLKRTDKSDLYGHEAMQRGSLDTAVMFLRKALQTNPYNEQALENLSEVYAAKGNLDSAFVLASFWAEAVPSNTTALQQICNIYYQKRDFSSMVTVASQIKKIAPTEMLGYWLSALAYIQMEGSHQNLQFALNDLQKVIEYRPDFKQAYIILAQIYQNAGDMASAQRCADIASTLN